MHWFVLLHLAAGPIGPGEAAAVGPAESVSAEVTITRLADDRWRVEYAFDAPVEGVKYGRPAAGYRERAWHLDTPGVSLELMDGQEAIVASDGVRGRFSVLVDRYTRFAPDQYAPFIPFSDGGAAVHLGFFAGEAIVGEEERPVDFRFRFAGRPGEHIVPPDGRRTDAYVYFGPQEPLATAHARLVIDPGTPRWLVDTFVRVTLSTTRIYADRLGGSLASAPLVLVGAGELDEGEGYSVKGGAVGGQLVMLLRGRALREASAENRAMFERLTAHELAHLWQLHTFPGAFDPDEPWLHEGGAEAIAVHALGEGGIWEESAVRAFAEDAAVRCGSALGGASLPEVTARGNWDAVYACGFGLFWSEDVDPLEAWSRLVEAVTRDGKSYSRSTLEHVLSSSPRPHSAP